MPNDNDRLNMNTQLPESQKLSVSDDKVRAIRDRMRAAKTRVEIAMQYTMWSEVREELRAAHSELALALAHIGR
jgi:hypothetical protein